MRNSIRYDYLIVGCGFSGAILARELAESNNLVKIIDSRNHIGGNAYDKKDDNGIIIHPYGLIFFTPIVRKFLITFQDLQNGINMNTRYCPTTTGSYIKFQ